MTKRSHAQFILGLLCLALVTAPAYAAEERALPWEDARRFAEALQTIREHYAEPVDDATLINEAIRGMAAGLDPYSVYLDPAEFQQARIDAFGRYEGIGVDVRRDVDGYVVITPFDGSPAERAGLQPGDRLLEANGEVLARLDPVQFNHLLDGATGSTVTLLVQRGDSEPFNVTLTRELIDVPSVAGKMIAADIAYFRIAMVSDNSAAKLARILTDIKHERLAGIILDLRNNAGGVVDGAVALADLFLDSGTIVSTRGRAAGQSLDYEAQPDEIAAGIPIVVLVNQGTASAAEILAAALQDHARAIVMGETTFGKGAVQSLIPLEGGGALKITSAHYRTPSGRRIEGSGIVPDIAYPAAQIASEDMSADALVAQARALLNRRSPDQEHGR